MQVGIDGRYPGLGLDDGYRDEGVGDSRGAGPVSRMGEQPLEAPDESTEVCGPGTATGHGHDTSVGAGHTDEGSAGYASTQGSGGAAPTTQELKKQLFELDQAVQRDTAEVAELRTAWDALATLKRVGDNIWLDGRMTPGELRGIADSGSAPPEARDAARYLLAHPDICARASEGGDLTWNAMGAELGRLDGKKKAAEQRLATDQARLAGVKIDLGMDPGAPTSSQPAGSAPKAGTAPKGPTGTGESSGSSGTPGSSGTSGAPGSTDALLARPLSLDMGTVQSGDPLTCATDRLTNAMGGLETQIDQLTAQLGQETDPAKRSAIEARLNQLNRAMTEVTNMLQQLTTMMQNIAKMFNDIAMNAIRHIA